MSSILVVEDEKAIREIQVAYLKQAGYDVKEAEDGDGAMELLEQNKFDLIVLDINLPKVNGFELCKKIRESSDVPIIIVTARTQEVDEVSGLEFGADDYIRKPFSPSVFLSRVRAILRRFDKKIIQIGELKIDSEKVIVWKNNKKIKLTSTQFNILFALASNPGKVFTRDEILVKTTKGLIGPDVLDRTVDAHIKSIRKKIEDSPSKPKYILTVIGKGYKFNEDLI
jgi:DNA-binding response OmpR family regulator